jgi:hypothetical protein
MADEGAGMCREEEKDVDEGGRKEEDGREGGERER